MSPHPFTLDRRATGPVPVCQCTLAMGAALHHPSRQPVVASASR